MSDVNDEIKLQTLYDHYKETFSYIREYIKSRDLFFLYALIILSLLFLQGLCPEETIKAVNSFIEKTVNCKVNFNTWFINNMFLFAFLSVLTKYFQITIHIERQYPYLHVLEKKLSVLAKDECFISREGIRYLDGYPWFSDWLHILYTWIFPILLLSAITIKLVIEFPSNGFHNIGYVFSLFFLLMIYITTILYLIFRATQKETQNTEE